MRNAQGILVGRGEKRISLAKSTRIWQANVKMYLKFIKLDVQKSNNSTNEMQQFHKFIT